MIAVSTLKLFNVTQAAKKLKLSVRRVQQFCEQNRLGQKVGESYIIPEDELETFRKTARIPGRPKKSA